MVLSSGFDLDASHAAEFLLDPRFDYLNHGSFGACPRSVLAAQTALREELERQPMSFLSRSFEARIDAARQSLCELLDAAPEQLVFMPNATTGVSTVLASLTLAPGDELLLTNHSYNACKNAIAVHAARQRARVVVAKVPFPVPSEDAVLEAILAAVTERTKLALIDHVTSPTGLVFPIARIVTELRARGVRVLVDGAHAPGLLELSLRGLGADYYTGNCHKWLCTPKGAGFLYVANEHAEHVPSLVASHGALSPRTDRPRLWLAHDWVGTTDPTAVLSIPAAITFLSSLYAGGLPALQARNRALALHARRVLCDALSIAPPAPEKMIAALVALPLPPARAVPRGAYADPLQRELLDAHGIEAMVHYFPEPPARVLRVCAQAYNYAGQYQRLARVLGEALRDAS